MSRRKILFLLLLSFASLSHVVAQNNGSISGRVMLDGKPAAAIVVVLSKNFEGLC